MVIVQVLGGAASQMSSVARGYLVAQALGKELILDVADYVSGYKFPYMMDYFDLPYRKLKYMHASPAVIGAHVIPDKVKEDFSPYIINTQGKTYADVCAEAQEHREQNIYLVGEGCTLPPQIDGLNFCMKENDFLDLFLQEINGHPSVAVHVRRTDFVTIGCAGEYSYYKAAVQYMKERISDAEFYFFSDNLEEVKKSLAERRNIIM